MYLKDCMYELYLVIACFESGISSGFAYCSRYCSHSIDHRLRNALVFEVFGLLRHLRFLGHPS